MAIVVRYFYSLIWCCRSRRFAPIEKESASLLDLARRVAEAHASQGLSRQVRDLETLYWATRESDVASMIFVSSSLTFAASVVFTIARICAIRALTNLAFVSAAASSVGAILAMFHLARKFWILAGLWVILRKKNQSVAPHCKSDLRLVRRVTLTQLLLTLARFCTASAAAVAFALFVAETGWGDKIATPSNLPFWIAMGAISTAVGSTLFFFVVEYVVRYKLSTVLGPFICNIFWDEIMAMHASLDVRPFNSVDTKHMQDVQTWEYTARAFLHKYRFDTVFAADRFGQILQFIQSGEILHVMTPIESS